MERYFGTYQTFQTVSRKEAAMLVGADNIVGDLFTIECTIEKNIQKAWLVNRFNQRIGYFEPDFSRKLSILTAQGMTLTGILSFIAYTDHPDPGFYWGQSAIIAYDPTLKDSFEPFIAQISKLIGKGIRPVIDLRETAINKVIESRGSWTPKDTVSLPTFDKGTAFIKTHRTITEFFVEEARKKNKGCYLASWLFLLALVALIIFTLKSCGLFS